MLPTFIVFAYLAAVLYIGIFAFRHREGREGAEQFFLAGRSVGPYVFLTSLFGTHMTAFAVLGSAGHAFGNWIARMTATRHPELVRGVALLAAAQRDFPRRLRDTIDRIMDATRPESARLADLQDAFFAPGHDARAWLEGWHPQVAHAQREAARASPAQAWWSAGGVPLLDVQADNDPFAPRSGAHLLQEELGPRVSIALIEDAGHALLPEQPAAVADVLAAFSAKLDANPYANP